MPENTEKVKRYRCPYCFLNETEWPLAWDPDKKEYWCHQCEFRGDEAKVLRFYDNIKSRFELINTRIKFE